MSSNNDNTMSVKELAAKLKITDALVKKLIKDFGIETLRVQKRIHLDDKSVTTIREIMALRASGKKNQEIKELFDASKAANQAEETPKTEVKAESKTKETNSETTNKETEDKKEKPIKAKKTREKKPKKPKTEIKKPSNEEASQTNQENKPPKETTTRSNKKEEEDGLDLTGFLEGEEDDEISMAMRLAADNEDSEDEEAINEELDLNDDDDDLDDDDDDDDDDETSGGKKQKQGSKKTRRRQFSFRYIQRQIANDAKRIQYIKQKLKRGRLSTKERLNLEDSLEHRSMLHSGWVHLLRWVKS